MAGDTMENRAVGINVEPVMLNYFCGNRISGKHE